jgi:HlyD family secretion protein
MKSSASSSKSDVANTRAGTVKACRRARLAPSVGGQIETLAVHEGDRVERGDLLLELWNQDLAAQVTLAEREAEAAEARARAACLNAENAEREAERQVKLKERGLASEEAVDRATTAAQAGRADCEAAQATARVQAARVKVVAEANLAKTRLKAPFDGVVAQVSGELNEYVTPSPPGIPTPARGGPDRRRLLLHLGPHRRGGRRPGAGRRRGPGEPGRLRRSAPSPAPVRRIAPYVLDAGEAGPHRGGGGGDRRSPRRRPPARGLQRGRGGHRGAPRGRPGVPTAAIRAGGGVLVLDPASGLIEERDIATGLGNWDYTQVTEGLEAGDR